MKSLLVVPRNERVVVKEGLEGRDEGTMKEGNMRQGVSIIGDEMIEG